MSHYTITPLEKKSIYVRYEMYRENDDGSISWFNIDDHYRWGKGFIAEDMDCNLPWEGDDTAYCKPGEGEGDGCDLDDQVACFFDFSDDIDEEEQEAIKEAYYDGGAGWLYDDPTHNWQEEDCYVVVLGPFRVDLCDANGTIIEEGIKLKQRPTPSNSWPFSGEENGNT